MDELQDLLLDTIKFSICTKSSWGWIIWVHNIKNHLSFKSQEPCTRGVTQHAAQLPNNKAKYAEVRWQTTKINQTRNYMPKDWEEPDIFQFYAKERGRAELMDVVSPQLQYIRCKRELLQHTQIPYTKKMEPWRLQHSRQMKRPYWT